jgi:hypothetical protein
MKTISTLILAVLFSVACLAQKSDSSNQTTGGTIGVISIEKIYPNPVKDIVNIDIQTNDPGEVQMSLYNILGTEVKKWETYYLNSGIQKVQLDLSQFKTGVYILRLTKQGQTKAQILKKVE